MTRLLRLPFFYGWIIIAVAFITMAIGVNVRTSFSLLYPPILDEFGWDRGTTAAVFSVGFISSALYTPFIGMLMDRYGPRLVMPLGILLVSAGLMLATWASQPWHLYVTLGVMVVGASILMSYIGHSMFLPNWFVRRRGLAIGIAFSGVGVGSILLFPWLQVLIDSVGWRQACWAMTGLLLIITLPLNLLFLRQRPEDLGLRADGDPAPQQRNGSQPDNVIDSAWVATEWTLPLALRTGRFWWVFAGFFSALFSWYAVQVHQTQYLVEIGFGAEQAAFALGLVGLTGIIGQITLGHLSDRIGREWVWTLSNLGFVLCYLLLLLLRQYPTDALLYPMIAAQGLLGYGIAAIYGAIPAELFQGKRFATIFGTLSLAATLGAGIGPWLTGVIYDRLDSYDLAFILAIVLSLLSCACIWLAAPRKIRAVAGRVGRH